MSGLLRQSHMTAGQDGVRDASSKQCSGFERATGSHGVSRVLGSIDHAICSFSSKLPASPQGGHALWVKMLYLGHCRWRSYAARQGVRFGGGARSEAVSKRSAAPRPRSGGVVAVIVTAADHQLPGYACCLVGERDRRELGRFALEQRDQPGRWVSASLANLLDQSGGANHQGAAQALIAGTRDDAQAHLAGSG